MTKPTAKNLAQIAKQVAQEPVEILKKAGEQVAGSESPTGQGQAPQEAGTEKEIGPDEKAKIEAQGQRQLQALEVELKDIRAQKEQREVVAREQEQVAQVQGKEAPKPLVEPVARPSRRFFPFGPKAQAQKQATRVEKILPPSG